VDCLRAQELFSDDHDQALAAVLGADLKAHLATCSECRVLREAMSEVVHALETHPVLEPPAGLVERVARASFTPHRVVSLWARAEAFLAVPRRFQVAAAVLAAATSALVFSAIGTQSAPRHLLTRLIERTANTGTYVAEKEERFVENLRILKVVVTTAFEGRIDRVNDRVDDYRRLLERRRPGGGEQKRAPERRTPDNAPSRLQEIRPMNLAAAEPVEVITDRHQGGDRGVLKPVKGDS